MKYIFTFCVLVFAIGTQAARPEHPFGTLKMHPKLEQLKNDMRFPVANANSRVAASGYPDSAVTFSWDGAAWVQDGAYRVRYTNGKISSITMYVVQGPISIPAYTYEYTYNATGNATKIEAVLTIPGSPPVVMNRFVMNYDIRGNQTALLIYQDNNGTLELNSGDSIAITYNGNIPTEATTYSFDFSTTPAAWAPNTRFQGITFGAGSAPTGLTISYWTGSAWNPEEERYSDVNFGLGYFGFSATFGGLIDVSNFLFTEVAMTENSYAGTPTDYVMETKIGGNWENTEKGTSTMAGGVISETVVQLWADTVWVNDNRASYTFTGGQLTAVLGEDYVNANWENSYRESWTYDASGNLTEEKGEIYQNNSWMTAFGNRNTYDYSSDNRVFRWVSEQFDMATDAYTNVSKREYYFGSFALNTSVAGLNTLKVYPNPVTDQLHISLEGKEATSLRAGIYNLQGQLVQNARFELTAGHNQLQLDVNALAGGIYQLRLQTGNGLEVVKFVK